MPGGIVEIEQRYSGPLPPPSQLEGYERAQAGLGALIVRWAHEEAEHRREMDRKIIDAEVADAQAYRQAERRGQAIGGALLGTGLLIALALAFLGHPAESAAALAAVLTGGTVAVVAAQRRRDPPPPKADEP